MQLHEINRWLERQVSENLISYFRDQGISGSCAHRPEYRKLLHHAKKRKIDLVLVYSIDRLSRTASEAIQTILMFDHIGVDFVSICQPIFDTPNNPFRRTMMMLFAELAELERTILITRVKAGLAAAKARGVKLGAPAKITASLKEKIRSLRAQNLTLRQIADQVKLSIGSVHKVLAVVGD